MLYPFAYGEKKLLHASSKDNPYHQKQKVVKMDDTYDAYQYTHKLNKLFKCFEEDEKCSETEIYGMNFLNYEEIDRRFDRKLKLIFIFTIPIQYQ